jgi:fatty-acyl-CoA synthase
VFDSRSPKRASRALVGRNIRPGERIAVLAENRCEYLELTLAAARTGAILCALNWRFSPVEIAHCMKLTRPALLFVSARHRDLLAAAGTPAGCEVIEFG